MTTTRRQLNVSPLIWLRDPLHWLDLAGLLIIAGGCDALIRATERFWTIPAEWFLPVRVVMLVVIVLRCVVALKGIDDP